MLGFLVGFGGFVWFWVFGVCYVLVPGPLTSTASATGLLVQASPQPHVQDLGNTGAAADEPGTVGDPAAQLGGSPGICLHFVRKKQQNPAGPYQISCRWYFLIGKIFH